jgi:hypothetical protein
VAQVYLAAVEADAAALSDGQRLVVKRIPSADWSSVLAKSVQLRAGPTFDYRFPRSKWSSSRGVGQGCDTDGMPKLPRARTAHTKQKPKPRLVSRAHRLEQDESQLALAATQWGIKQSAKAKRHTR